MAHFLDLAVFMPGGRLPSIINVDHVQSITLDPETTTDPITDKVAPTGHVFLRIEMTSATLWKQLYNSLAEAAENFLRLRDTLIRLDMLEKPEIATEVYEYNCVQCKDSYSADVPEEDEDLYRPCPSCGKHNAPIPLD